MADRNPSSTQRSSNARPTTEGRSVLSKRITQIVVDLVVIIIIFVIFAIVYFQVAVKIRYFTCDDSEIFFPYKPDTIPFWAVGIFGTVGPLVFIIGVECFNSRLLYDSKRRPFRDRLKVFLVCFFHAFSLFVLGIAITLLLTEIGKRWVGRLRPHFISVCAPVISQLNCTSGGLTGFVYNSIYTGDNFCTGDPSKVQEARFSFPSGHSSYSWYTMGFLMFYLEARLILLMFRYVKPLIQMTAFIAAYVTCISRIGDYHHRGSDVIGGSILGLVIAVLVTMVLGRVLWEYEIETPYYEIDDKIKAKAQRSV